MAQGLHYKMVGQGPDLVLIHGFLESISMWNDLVDRLSSNYRLIMIDLPGHGQSLPIGPVCGMDQMADLVWGVLTDEKITRANFMGHSMGGYVLLELLQKNPALFKSIVLLNSSSLADSEARLKARRQALKLLEQNKDRFLELTINGLFATEDRPVYARQIKKLIKQAKAMSTEGISAAINGMMQRSDHTHTLKKYKGNKMALAGSRDPLLDMETSERWTQAAKTPLRSFDCGHMIWMEEPTLDEEYLHFIEKM